jgi:hypothetical protein
VLPAQQVGKQGGGTVLLHQAPALSAIRRLLWCMHGPPLTTAT